MNQQVANLTNLYTGRGRFIQGDLDKKQDKDYENKPIAPEDQEYFFAVAVPKTDPNVGGVLAQLHGLASQAYQGHAGIFAQVNQGLAATGFSWKVEDGDVPTHDPQTGQPKPILEYKQGCYIFKFKTRYEFGACDAQYNNIDRAAIKRGDYVDVMFTASPNGRFDGNAGIILYPNAIAFLDAGEAIAGAVNAADAFRGRQMNSSGQAHPSAAATYQGGNAQGNGMPAADGQMHQSAQGAGAAMGQNGMASAQGAGGMMQQQQNGMPAAGNPGNAGGGMPPAGGSPVMGAGGANPAMTGQAPQTGGMPPAGQGMGTTSHTDPAAAGVTQHNGILHGPAGAGGGGMPGA